MSLQQLPPHNVPSNSTAPPKPHRLLKINPSHLSRDKISWTLSQLLWPREIPSCKYICNPESHVDFKLSPVIESFSTSSNHKGVNIPFPTNKRPEIRTLTSAPLEEISEWFSTCGVKLGNKIPSNEARNLVLQLLFTYKDLHAEKLEDMPPTDLYIHKIKVKAGTKPWNKRKQKRWPADKKWWLHKIIEGVTCNMYETTLAANGQFSEWNSQAVLVDKTANPDWGEEPRV
ncbi:hypothetical protein K3495_g15861, partial [Podosphaera aphanis]